MEEYGIKTQRTLHVNGWLMVGNLVKVILFDSRSFTRIHVMISPSRFRCQIFNIMIYITLFSYQVVDANTLRTVAVPTTLLALADTTTRDVAVRTHHMDAALMGMLLCLFSNYFYSREHLPCLWKNASAGSCLVFGYSELFCLL